jgi:hypothetical protein
MKCASRPEAAREQRTMKGIYTTGGNVIALGAGTIAQLAAALGISPGVREGVAPFGPRRQA